MVDERVKNHLKRTDEYFCNHRESIRDTNLNLMLQCVMFALPVFLFFLLITPLMYTGWKPHWIYWMMIPVLLFYGIIAGILKRKRNLSCFRVQVVCVSFYILLLLELIGIDIIPYEKSQATFFPIVLVIFSVLFIAPYWVYILVDIGMTAIFMYASLMRKVSEVSANDMFNAMVGLCVSLVVAWMVLGIRSKEGVIKSELTERSTIDFLTGTLNKITCETAIAEYLKHRSAKVPCALYIFDMDNFKDVNDKLGHGAGDELLAKMGEILRHTFRTSDIVGRIGGDEFMVLFRAVPNYELLDRKCRQVMKSLAAVQIEDGWTFTCSIGVAVDEGDATFEEMYRNADDAMYEAKVFGKGGFVKRVPSALNIQANKQIMLIVDDMKTDRMLLRSNFEDEFEIVEADSGHEALNVISQYKNSIGIVLLDLMMPELSGIEVLKYMKTRPAFSHIPVVIITGDGQSEEEVLELGADEMLVKPIDSAVLRLRVQKIIRSRNN